MVPAMVLPEFCSLANHYIMKATATLFAVLLTATLQAQVTLQQSMIAPGGVQLAMYVVTAPGSATVPSDGANQTWDLSTITVQPVGTLDFIAASATPFAANYPTANWVWAQSLTGEGTDYVYLSITSSGIEVVANDVPSATNNYTDPKRILQFPMSLGQSLTDSYVDMDGPSSVTWAYTGHGTAITPLGTFTDLAKVVSTEDDLLLWNTTPLYPLVIDNGSTVLVFAPSNVGIEGIGARAAVQVYPNPCTDRLVVEGAFNTAWRITYLQGRTVRNGSFNGMELQHLDVAELTTGSYFLLLDADGTDRAIRFNKQ